MLYVPSAAHKHALLIPITRSGNTYLFQIKLISLWNNLLFQCHPCPILHPLQPLNLTYILYILYFIYEGESYEKRKIFFKFNLLNETSTQLYHFST
jgi:hypothetical protein